jgi:hypothetical protein
MAPRQPNQSNKEATYVADPGTRIGHVHLKAADLERSIRFYFWPARTSDHAASRRFPGVFLRRWLRPSRRAEHLGQPRWPIHRRRAIGCVNCGLVTAAASGPCTRGRLDLQSLLSEPQTDVSLPAGPPDL